MGSNLKLFFWQKDFPVRSFHRIFIFLSLFTYIAGRLIDPGPIWMRSLIESLVYKFNLDLIHAIPFINYSANGGFWSGGGLALQIQMLFIYPLSWVFAFWSSCYARYGSPESHKLYQELNVSHNCWNQLIQPNILLLIVLGIGYFPFLGEKITLYKPYGVAGRVLTDSFGACIFFILAGCVIIYIFTLYVLALKKGLRIIFKKGN